ncbi:hypothetical protein Slala04_73350 [Streptomyces lavendulae subsp. lavendulae]|nr:hypothetical protein Slala04_73350 [Streptomyces lavendulae subsp. lavendulae]
MLITGCGGRQATITTGSVTTTVVQDSQWVTAAISAGAVLISSAAAAWITHYLARDQCATMTKARTQWD